MPSLVWQKERRSQILDDERAIEQDIKHFFSNSGDFLDFFGQQNISIAEEVTDGEMHSPLSSRPDDGPCCYSCSQKIRLNSGHVLKKGMHIIWGRIFSICGKSPYYHHGIVSEIDWSSDNKAKISVIEFSSIGMGCSLSVQETVQVIDVKNEKVFYKRYAINRYTDDEIVNRARTRIGDMNYNLLHSNCENMAVWCVSGEDESFQVAEEIDRITPYMSYFGALCGKIYHFCNKTKLFYWGKTHAIKIGTYFVGGVLFAVVIFVGQLIVTVCRYINLRNQKKGGFICTRCFNSKKIELLSKIVMSVGAITCISIIHPLSTKVFCFVGILASLVGLQFVPKATSFAYRKLKSLFNPFYGLYRIVVSSPEMLVPGVLLTISNDHTVILNSVDVLKPPCSVVPKIMNLGLTYSKCSYQKNVKFELEDTSNCFLQVLNDVRLDIRETKEVLKLAKLLLLHGNKITKEDIFKCKFLNYDEKARFDSNYRMVESVKCVHVGDVIRFKFSKSSRWLIGIVMEKTVVPDIFLNLEYFHVGQNKQLCLETTKFDLNKRKLYVHSCSTNDYHSREKILRMAKANLGKPSLAFFYKSNSFVKTIVTRPQEGDILSSGHDIKQGMAIKLGKPFTRKGKDVTEIRYFVGDKKQFLKEGHSIITTIYQTGEKTALVKMVKYDSMYLNTIIERDEELNLNTETIYVQLFSHNEQEQDQIVEYARFLSGKDFMIKNDEPLSNRTCYEQLNSEQNIKHGDNTHIANCSLDNCEERFRQIKKVFRTVWKVNPHRLGQGKEIRKGDILIIPNNYKIVVKCVEIVPREDKYCKQVELDIVHFAWPKPRLFTRRIVQEEKFTFDLKNEGLQVLRFFEKDIELDDKTIENAKNAAANFSRFNIRTNRSSHMCKLCKIAKTIHHRQNRYHRFLIKQIKKERFKDRRHESIQRVMNSADVKVADIVNFKYYRLNHKGIVVGKRNKNVPEDIVKIEYFHLPKENILRSCSSVFDLSEDEIFICGLLDDYEQLLHGMDELTNRIIDLE